MSLRDATNATGKRKRAICRAWIQTGSGKFTVNDRPLESYFPRATHRTVVTYPIEIANLLGKLDVTATIEASRLEEGRLAHQRFPHEGAEEIRAEGSPQALPVLETVKGQPPLIH